MKREIIAYKGYFKEFFENLDAGTQDKILYVLKSNIYRIFFCFDEGRIVILFNGFQKKTEKTPKKEIDKAKILRKEYYGSKNK